MFSSLRPRSLAGCARRRGGWARERASRDWREPGVPRLRKRWVLLVGLQASAVAVDNSLVGAGRPPSFVSPMRYLKTTEAAALLNVGPSALRAWERRFDFPKPQPSVGGHRYYTHGEVAALRDALQRGVSISAAVMRATAGLAADADSLVRALLAYDRDRADLAIETALALRSVERSVEEVLLPSLDEIVSRHGADSAARAFSALGR
jgi:DNA-binding transcriptional MerR regulator